MFTQVLTGSRVFSPSEGALALVPSKLWNLGFRVWNVTTCVTACYDLCYDLDINSRQCLSGLLRRYDLTPP